jgi:hypothetical protein
LENPVAGLAALIAGRHGLTDTRELVATISSVLLNQDHVKAELQALRGKATFHLVSMQKSHVGSL